MRHEPEDAAGGVGERGGVSNAAIGVFRIHRSRRSEADIFEGYASHRAKPLRRVVIAVEDETPFAVPHGEVELLARLNKGAAALLRGAESNPAVFVAAGLVQGQRCTDTAVVAREQAHANENLKAVTDSEDECAAIDEGAELVAEMMVELIGEELSAGDVVAVTEAAGDGEKLITGEGVGRGDELFDVNQVTVRSRALPGEDGFFVAVDAGGAEDEDTGLSHAESVAVTPVMSRSMILNRLFDGELSGPDNRGVNAPGILKISALLCGGLRRGARCMAYASLIWVMVVCACEKPPAREVTTRPAAKRIISISPNSTEIIASLGAADRLVAVSNFCVWPESIKDLPRIGGLFDVNLEAMLTLRPDLVVLRGRQKAVEDLCAANGITLFEDKTETLEDIYKTLRELGELLDARDKAIEVEREMRGSLDRIARVVAGRPRPRVLFTIARNTDSISSVMTGAKGTFVDDMIRVSGGDNVFADSAIAYPTISPEAMLVAQPDVIIEAMPELELTKELERKLLAQWQDFAGIPAVKNGRVHIVSDENATIPSPRIVDVIARLARLLHPEAKFD